MIRELLGARQDDKTGTVTREISPVTPEISAHQCCSHTCTHETLLKFPKNRAHMAANLNKIFFLRIVNTVTHLKSISSAHHSVGRVHFLIKCLIFTLYNHCYVLVLSHEAVLIHCVTVHHKQEKCFYLAWSPPCFSELSWEKINLGKGNVNQFKWNILL